MDGAYLKGKVGEPLAAGLAAIAKLRPQDPVEFLGQFLLKWVENADRHDDWKRLAEELEVERESWLEAQKKAEEDKKREEAQVLETEAKEMARIRENDTALFDDFNAQKEALESGTLKVKTLRHFAWKKYADMALEHADSPVEDREDDEEGACREDALRLIALMDNESEPDKLEPFRKNVSFAQRIILRTSFANLEKILALRLPDQRIVQVLKAFVILLDVQPPKRKQTIQDWNVLRKMVTEDVYHLVTEFDVERRHKATKFTRVKKLLEDIKAGELQDLSFAVFILHYWIMRNVELRDEVVKIKMEEDAVDALDDILSQDDENEEFDD